MIRLLLAVLLSCGLSCGLSCVMDKNPDNQIFDTRPEIIYRDYDRGADHWTGHLCRVQLDPMTYTTAHQSIQWSDTDLNGNLAILFICTGPPRDNRDAVTVTGRCHGILPGTDYVTFSDCDVTRR
jgi:hypothetical protein